MCATPQHTAECVSCVGFLFYEQQKSVRAVWVGTEGNGPENGPLSHGRKAVGWVWMAHQSPQEQ